MEKQNFIQVEYDVLASTELDSTEKLFIAYILGWQKNGKECRETNNTLANIIHFVAFFFFFICFSFYL